MKQFGTSNGDDSGKNDVPVSAMEVTRMLRDLQSTANVTLYEVNRLAKRHTARIYHSTGEKCCNASSDVPRPNEEIDLWSRSIAHTLTAIQEKIKFVNMAMDLNEQ